MWSDLILAYVAETGLYELDLSPKILTLPLFTNPTINSMHRATLPSQTTPP